MIRCENISKIYKTKDYNIAANKNISLEIKDGEIVWVAGVSGAGKSTLLHILSSIDIPTEGSVYWNNDEVSKYIIDNVPAPNIIIFSILILI